MRRIIAISKRILSQFTHDKRTLALLFVAPIIVIWLLSVLLGTASYIPKIATVNLPSDYQEVLDNQKAIIMDSTEEEAKALLDEEKVDGILTFEKENATLHLKLEGSDRTRNATVTAAVSKATSEYSNKVKEQLMQNTGQGNATSGDATGPADTTGPTAATGQNAVMISGIEKSYLHGGSDWKMFDYLGPIFIGLFIFVFTFLTSGMSLVNEKSRGTMSRFLATPIKSYQILGGYSIGFGILAMVQASLILFISLKFIGFPNEGNLVLVILIAISLAIASVTMGLLVSGLATNAFQVIQLMLMFVVPQILLCGLFDLSSAPDWLQVLSKCLPLTYGVDAMKEVMIRGSSFSAISFDMIIVWGFIIAFFVLAAFRYRKKRA